MGRVDMILEVFLCEAIAGGMPCIGPDQFTCICDFEPTTFTHEHPIGGVAFAITYPGRRCRVCDGTASPADLVSVARLLAGLALADLGRPSPEAVKEIRLGLDMRSVDLAQLLGVTSVTISHWENGHTALPRAVWVTLASMAAEALGKPAMPQAWLRAAQDPLPMPKRLELDTTAHTRPLALDT